MPSRPMRPCPKHRGVLVASGQVCPKCMVESVTMQSMAALAERRAKGNATSAAVRGYGREHAEKRRDLLRRKPYCDDPFRRHPTLRKPATIRDHKTPLAQGGSDDKDNEQALCQSCHTYKTYRDGSYHRGRVGKNVS